MTRLALLALALAALLPGAALADWTPIPPRSAVCGSPSPVGDFGAAGHGAALGPLVLPFDDGFGGAEQRYESGFPTRVVIRSRGPRNRELTLRGYHCGTGLPLRFWYRKEPLRFSPGFPTTDEQLRGKGDLGVRFGATTKLRGTYSGFMLFWAPGDWRLVLRAGPTAVASAVVHVSEQHNR